MFDNNKGIVYGDEHTLILGELDEWGARFVRGVTPIAITRKGRNMREGSNG